MDFFGDFGLLYKSFTRWCQGIIVMRSRYRIWYLYINLAWTHQFFAKLLNWNCYRLLRVTWALAQISCTYRHADSYTRANGYVSPTFWPEVTLGLHWQLVTPHSGVTAPAGGLPADSRKWFLTFNLCLAWQINPGAVEFGRRCRILSLKKFSRAELTPAVRLGWIF